MKKILAMLLAVMMVLTASLAEEAEAGGMAIDVKLSVDREVAEDVMIKMGMEEEKITSLRPLLALLASVEVKLTEGENGILANLSLNGREVLFAGGAATEEEMLVASTLFPHYLISISPDMMSQLMSHMPGFTVVSAPGAETGVETGAPAGGETVGTDGSETGGASDVLMPAASGAVAAAMGEFMEVLGRSVAPGKSEQGTYEFEGITFDTKTPLVIDALSLARAEKRFVETVLKDEGVRSMLPPFLNPDALLSLNEEMMAEDRIPEVAATVYTIGENSEPMYIITESTHKGEDSPSIHFTMLNKGDGEGAIGIRAAKSGLEVSVSYTKSGYRVEYKKDKTWLAADVTTVGNDFSCALYFLEPAKPLLTLAISVESEGRRVITLDTENKTVVKLEKLASKNAIGEMFGILSDIMTNGWPQTMAALTEAVPEVKDIHLSLPSFSLPGFLGGDSGSSREAAEPEAVDPAEWKTLGDVLALYPQMQGMERGTAGDGYYYIAFKYAGKYWMVTAPFTDEQFQQLMAIDVFADDRDEQELAILGPIPVESAVDLETLAMTDEEEAAWIGLTGQALLDAGWEPEGFAYAEDGTACMSMVWGKFRYWVYFEGGIDQPANWDEMPDFVNKIITGFGFEGQSWHYFDE